MSCSGLSRGEQYDEALSLELTLRYRSIGRLKCSSNFGVHEKQSNLREGQSHRYVTVGRVCGCTGITMVGACREYSVVPYVAARIHPAPQQSWSLRVAEAVLVLLFSSFSVREVQNEIGHARRAAKPVMLISLNVRV